MSFPELKNLEEVRNMLAERVVDWTEQWKQEGLQQGLREGLQQGLQAERRLLLRLIRRQFSEAIAAQSTRPWNGLSNRPSLEDLGEHLFDCADEKAWLARVQAAGAERH